MESTTILFNPIFRKLDEMQKSEKVDLSIIDDFTHLEDELTTIEKSCTSTKGRKVEDVFLFYHAIRSSRMIINKINIRFAEAKKRHENPVVVDLSKMVLPNISELCSLIIPLCGNSSHVMSDGEKKAILIRLKKIRDNASSTQMLPTVEEERKGLEQKKLQTGFQGLMQSIQASVDEE